MKIKILKFNENLIVPTRGHYDDAGMDCYALEDFTLEPMGSKNLEMIETEKYRYINNTHIVPLGFGLEVPHGCMATIRPRSSMNIKGILTQIGTIDSGYRGEIKAALCNLTNNPIDIKKGDKICQIVIEPVIIADLVNELGEERGTGGFGSTGK